MSENMTAKATIKNANYITSIEVDEFQMQADEPISLGGSGTGPTPINLLHSSLASCVAITLKMYVDRKGWDVGDISVNVISERLAPEEFRLTKVITTTKEVPTDQKKRMRNIADKCPVAKMLKGGVEQAVVFE